MKIKMTNAEVIDLSNALEALNYRGVKFAYTIARNLNSMKPIIKAIDASLQIPQAFTDYDKARVALAKEHSKKDAQGKPMVEGEHYIMENMEKFDKDLEALRAKHKDAIDARNKQLEEYKGLLKESVSVELFPIAQALLPNDISTKEMNSIFAIIQHEEPVESPLSKEFAAPKPGKKGKGKGK